MGNHSFVKGGNVVFFIFLSEKNNLNGFEVLNDTNYAHLTAHSYTVLVHKVKWWMVINYCKTATGHNILGLGVSTN